MARITAKSMEAVTNFVEPSALPKTAPAECADPQLPLNEIPHPSWTITSPDRAVPFDPPEKMGSSQYQLIAPWTLRSYAFSPTINVCDSPSVTAARVRTKGKLGVTLPLAQ